MATEEMEYAISWLGIPVGRMIVNAQEEADGTLQRAVQIAHAGWLSLIYPVDNRVHCVSRHTAEGRLHQVTRRIGEKDFVQSDQLRVLPDAGQAVFLNALDETETSFSVPPDTLDYVCFFFALREALPGLTMENAAAQPVDYALVMDDAVHPLALYSGAAKTIRTEKGKISAAPVRVVSKSPALFARNRPEKVWVLPEPPVVVLAEVETRFNRVKAHLVRWEKNGEPVLWGPVAGK